MGLGHWLAWTAACGLPCAGLWHWAMVVQDADCRTGGTSALLTPLTVAIVLGSNVFYTKAIAGFGPLFRQTAWCDWAKPVALGWAVVRRLLLAGWLLLDAMLVLTMAFSWFGDGKSIWAN